MRKHLAIWLMMAFAIEVQSQIAFYDAQWLAKTDGELVSEVTNNLVHNELGLNELTTKLLLKKQELARYLEHKIRLDKYVIQNPNQSDSVKRHNGYLNSISETQTEITDLERKINRVGENAVIDSNGLNQIQNLAAFLNDPFSGSIDPIDFDLIQELFKKASEVAESDWQGSNSSLNKLTSLVPTAISATGAFNGKTESAFIDGLTGYIADEFKKGVTTTYVDVFEKRMDKVGELQIFIPSTYTMLKDRNPFEYPDFGKEWKATIHKDLRDLLPNFLAYVEKPDERINTKFLTRERAEKIRSQPAFGYAMIAKDLVAQVTDKIHPADLLTYLDTKYYNSDYEINKLKNILHGLNVLQSNLRDTTKQIANQSSSIWIGFEKFNELNTEEELKYFAGLLYQRDTVFFKSLKEEVFVNGQFKLNKFKTFYRQKIQPIQETLIKIQEFYEDQKDEDDFLVYLKFFVELVEIGNEKYGKTSWDNQSEIAVSLIDAMKAKKENLLTNLKPEEILDRVLAEIQDPLLKRRVTLFLEDLSEAEKFLQFLKSEEASKDITKIEELIKPYRDDLEKQIMVLSLSKNCKISIEELRLIRDIAKPADILSFIKSSKYNTLGTTQLKLIEYKENVEEIMEIFNSEDDVKASIKAIAIANLDQEWVDLFEDALAIYQSIKEKDYGLLVNNSLSIIEAVTGKEITDPGFDELLDIKRKVKKARMDVVKHELNQVAKDYYQSEFRQLKTRLEELNTELGKTKSYQRFVNLFRKYVDFLVEVANAEDPDQMKKVISTVVAPSNSYLKKRAAPFFATITAHPGVYLSSEKLKDGTKWKGNVGLTGPIGVDIGIGLLSKEIPKTGKPYKMIKANGKGKYRSGHSLSAFVQLIDVGAVLNYRIGDDETDELPTEVNFSQIWSPGATVNWGFRNSPWTLGLGYQRSPKLREVVPDNDDGSNPGIISAGDRILLRLTWDIPLINLYTKKI